MLAPKNINQPILGYPYCGSYSCTRSCIRTCIHWRRRRVICTLVKTSPSKARYFQSPQIGSYNAGLVWGNNLRIEKYLFCNQMPFFHQKSTICHYKQKEKSRKELGDKLHYQESLLQKGLLANTKSLRQH